MQLQKLCEARKYIQLCTLTHCLKLLHRGGYNCSFHCLDSYTPYLRTPVHSFRYLFLKNTLQHWFVQWQHFNQLYQTFIQGLLRYAKLEYWIFGDISCTLKATTNITCGSHILSCLHEVASLIYYKCFSIIFLLSTICSIFVCIMTPVTLKWMKQVRQRYTQGLCLSKQSFFALGSDLLQSVMILSEGLHLENIILCK